MLIPMVQFCMLEKMYVPCVYLMLWQIDLGTILNFASQRIGFVVLLHSFYST